MFHLIFCICSGARDDDVKDYTRVSRFSRSAFYLRWRDVEMMKRLMLNTYILIVQAWLNSTENVMLWNTEQNGNTDWMCLTGVNYKMVISCSLSAFYRLTFPDFSLIGFFPIFSLWWGRLGYGRPRGRVSRVWAHKTIADTALWALP